jgi:bifunctional UDP-N-acetylglucosamine pyrophosphorylase/glucosamine-1-phosphate N-acetyltransferase
VTGESDMGLFSLSADAARQQLPLFAAGASASASTGERNFLPYIPWLAAMAAVRTFPASDPMEAIGVNTADERARVEAFLTRR